MITQIISIISSWTLSVIGRMGYGGVFILSFFESAGIPIPSEVVLPFSGFLAFSGRFDFWFVVIVASLANYAGSVALFYIGKSGGRWFLEKYGKYVLISRHDLETGDRWFHRHGGKIVFWGRLLPIVRTFISLPAGVARMDFRKFSLYTIAGALPWNGVLAYIGFRTGASWDSIKSYFHLLDYVVILLLVLTIGWFICKKIWTKKN